MWPQLPIAPKRWNVEMLVSINWGSFSGAPNVWKLPDRTIHMRVPVFYTGLELEDGHVEASWLLM